ncbi:MAG: LysR family transcriptional regulator [Polyangiaceae bacterium]|nr:LysR family transcriptional regulator [Polyangiaceae bacterium]
MEWSDLVPLLAVARAKSFGGAARRLGVSTTTVTRRVDALEASLGLRLVDRQTDGATLTEHGVQIVKLAEDVEERAAALDRAAAALRDDVAPRLRISSTETVVTGVLAPALGLLLETHPEIRVELQVNPELVSLARRDADLAVRMLKPEGNSLVGRRLAGIELGLYASRSYLGRKRPEDVVLADECLLSLNDSFGRIAEVLWFENAGLTSAIRMRTSSTQALLAAVRAGVGIALLPDVFGNNDPSLVALDADTAFPSRTPWLVTHRDLRRVPAVKAVSQWIVDAFDRSARRRTGRRA